nr:sugar phosphate nucleotidyltransferase [Pseudobdellovibrionaceae bacterium]
SDDPTKTVMKQMVDLHNDKNSSVVSVMKVEDRDVQKYGIAEAVEFNNNDWFKVKSLVEKPQYKDTPSRWALTGRYVLSGNIFKFLKNAKPGVQGEIQLTDSMDLLSKEQGMWALCLKALRLDAGDKFGYLRANIEMALRDKEVRSEMLEYIAEIVKREKGPFA